MRYRDLNLQYIVYRMNICVMNTEDVGNNQCGGSELFCRILIQTLVR